MLSKPALDLTKTHFIRPMFGKGITVYGTWFRTEEGQFRPCLVLLPSNRKVSHTKVRPCVVTVDEAFMWAEETGDPRYAAGASSVFTQFLGSDPITITNIIHGELSELMKIPALPPGELQVVADGFMTDTHGKRIHRELIERV